MDVPLTHRGKGENIQSPIRGLRSGSQDPARTEIRVFSPPNPGLAEKCVFPKINLPTKDLSMLIHSRTHKAHK